VARGALFDTTAPANFEVVFYKTIKAILT